MRSSIWPALSVARSRSRRSSSASGASTKIVTAPGHLARDRERAVELELEQRHRAGGGDPLELAAQRARALPPGEAVVLEEVTRGEVAVELLVGDEPVVDAVALARAARPRRRGDGQPQPRDAVEQDLHHRPLAGARGPGEDEDRRPTG